MPVLLYLDTSASKATIALSRDSVVLGFKMHDEAKEQAAWINTAIERVLEQSGLTLQEVNALCICAGPGSYTGLRVGLGVAKGIAFALDKKLMLFDRLRLIALSFTGPVFEGKEKLVVLKARKDEYFFARFDSKQAVLTPPDHIFAPALLDLTNKMSPDVICITDDEQLPVNLEKHFIREGFTPDLKAWMKRAEKRALQQDWDDLAYSEPYYLKAAFTTQSKKYKY